MKIKLRLFLFVAALALAVLACGGGADAPEAQDSNVLFQDDFSNKSGDWDTVRREGEGITDYEGEAYQIRVDTVNTDVWANPGDLSFGDVRVEVKATKQAGGTDNNDFGVICRYKDESNFYFFIISSDGYYGIGKVKDGAQELIGMDNMMPSDAINIGDQSNQHPRRLQRHDPDPVCQWAGSRLADRCGLHRRQRWPARRHIRRNLHRHPVRRLQGDEALSFMKIYLDTVGCRLNQSEIETFARQFRAAGHQLVASPAQADLVVVNTCTVTAAAASDSRQHIRQAARAAGAQVVVTGCWATLEPEQAAGLPGVSRVIGNLDKDRLVPLVLGAPPEAFELEFIQRTPIPGARLRTRAFIKAQDGCNNRCTFCITSLARGPSAQPLDPRRAQRGERRPARRQRRRSC